jgi:tetratricopeptide (TPR) repeat protein
MQKRAAFATVASVLIMTRKRLFTLLIVLLLTGGSVGAFFALRAPTPTVPVIAIDSLDSEVAAAIAAARADVAAQPRSASTWGKLGMVLFAQDMYQECAGVFAEAERLAPEDARWPYLRGLALLLTQPEAAAVLLERAAALPPHSDAMRLRLAETWLRLDRLDEADLLLQELLQINPQNPRVLLGRGQVLARRGQWHQALAPLRAAAVHPTAQRAAHVALAEVYTRLGNPGAAGGCTRRAAEMDTDVSWLDPLIEEVRALRTGLQPRIDRALFLSNAGQIDEALELIQQVLHDHPSSDEAHLTLAKVLIRANQHDKAQTALRQAIQLNPRLADAHFLLGGIQMMHKDYPAAEPTYLRTISLKPNHGRAHYLLGDCRLKQGKKELALAAFGDAVRYRPDFAPAQIELGALLLESGQREAALTHLEQAVHLDGASERARKLLAEARSRVQP